MTRQIDRLAELTRSLSNQQARESHQLVELAIAFAAYPAIYSAEACEAAAEHLRRELARENDEQARAILTAMIGYLLTAKEDDVPNGADVSSCYNRGIAVYK
jgi:hypothetical protein